MVYQANTLQKNNSFFWFYLFNIILLWCIGFQYLQIAFNGYGSAIAPTSLNELDAHHPAFFTWALFILFTYTGYIAAFLIAPAFITLFLNSIHLSKWLSFFVSSILVSIIIFYFTIDARIYSIYHYHLNGVILKMFFSGDVIGVFDFSLLEWLIFIIGGVTIILFEAGIMLAAERIAVKYSGKKVFYLFNIFLVISLLLSLQIFFYASMHLVFGKITGVTLILASCLFLAIVWNKYIVKTNKNYKLFLAAIPIICLLVAFILGAFLANYDVYHVILYLSLLSLGLFIVCVFILHTKIKFIPIFALIFSCAMLLFQMFVMEYVAAMRQVIEASYLFPFYNVFTRTILAFSRHDANFYNINNGFFMQPKGVNTKLHYPLQVLTNKLPPEPYNVVMIIIDTWRYDALTKEITPQITEFAKQTWQFKNHWSGGNATQSGMFSLFYGLPSNYWTAMLDQHKGPVLFQALLKNNYRVGVFSSSELAIPALYKTVFQNVPNLKIMADGDYIFIRDQNVNQEFFDFLNRDAKKPFFSVLFYDGAHGYCALGNPIHKFQPEAATCGRFLLSNDTDPTYLKNRYKNALLKIDGLIGNVIANLKAKNLLKNTVVIITGDHGEEFNDNHLNFWEHASNYTKYQVQTPLLIYWPGKQAKMITERTSHFDLAPTILRNVLGYKGDSSAYAIGSDLLNNYHSSPYLVVGSYNSMGIVEADRITMLLPDGDYSIYDHTYRVMPHEKLHGALLQAALHDMIKYYER